ncbi:MAG: hypothetical protein M1823_003453 [Watsoniomyces obsoletus]|nr:MAG: hypothetical protein M1823_003453 [Watsoniomyces obsoletus]
MRPLRYWLSIVTLTTVAVSWPVPAKPRNRSRHDKPPTELVGWLRTENGGSMMDGQVDRNTMEVQEEDDWRKGEQVVEVQEPRLYKRSSRQPSRRLLYKQIQEEFAEAIKGVKGRHSTRAEIEENLKPEEFQKLMDSLKRRSGHSKALAAIDRAKAAKREPTLKETEDLSNAQAASATYRRLRLKALRSHVLSGEAPFEVLAYWEGLRTKKKEYHQGVLDDMTDDERAAYYEQLSRINKERYAARANRIEELTARATAGLLDDAEQRELDDLTAQRDDANRRNREAYAALSPDEKAAELEALKARTRPIRENELATRKRLEPLVQSGEATVEEQETYWELRGKVDRENAKRQARNKYVRELEKIVNDPNGGATEEQKQEWAAIVAERERRKAKNQARKKTQNQQGDGSNSKDGQPSSLTRTTDPSNHRPLQMPLNSPLFPGKQAPSWLAHGLNQLPHDPHDIRQLAGQASKQLGVAVKNNWRSISTAAKNPSLYLPKALPRPAGLPAGASIPI